jgi:hypothetical protein
MQAEISKEILGRFQNNYKNLYAAVVAMNNAVTIFNNVVTRPLVLLLVLDLFLPGLCPLPTSSSAWLLSND